MVSDQEKMLRERIRQLLAYERKTIADMADNETLRVRYRRQINGDAAVPYTTIVLILDMFPEISADWLVMGEGSMIKTKQATTPHITSNVVKGSSAGGSINVGTTIQSDVQRMLDEKDKRIAELEKDKELLQGLLTAFAAGSKN